jgi:hypothetical protein
VGPGDVSREEENAITVPGSPTPEPTSFMLVGAGLTAFGLDRRRARRARTS